MKRAFLLVFVFIPILLTACGQPILGFVEDDLIIVREGSVINPGSSNSCEVTADTKAQVTNVKIHSEGSTHHEQRLTVVSLEGDGFPCKDGELYKGYIYGSNVRTYNP